MDVKTEITDRVALYRLAGRLDALSSPQLESAVAPACSGDSPNIIFDMRDVSFVSSAGVRIILMTAKKVAAAKGGFALFGVQPAVNQVFEISGLQRFIPIVADESEARSRLEPRA